MYTQGDTETAKRLLEKYCAREISEKRGEVIYSEEKIEISLPCAPFDTTGEEIVIQGTVDQIRAIGKDTLYVVDHKTGLKSGEEMVRAHMPQLAVYMLGVMRRFPNKKVKGFITRIQDLGRINLPFWWEMPMRNETEVLRVLSTVVNRVALLRMGLNDSTPGKYCDWCPLAQYPACIALPLGYRDSSSAEDIASKVESKLKPKPKTTLTVSDLFK